MTLLGGLTGSVDQLLALVDILEELGFDVERADQCAAAFTTMAERRFNVSVDAGELEASLRVGVLARDESRRCWAEGRQ